MERYNKFVAVFIIYYYYYYYYYYHDNINILLFLLFTIFLNYKITRFSYDILI